MERTERIGRQGELMFAAEAVARGLTVLQPSGVHGYDWVVEHNGKFTRVQVKTTSVLDQDRRYKWNIKTKDRGTDVYALYVIDTDMFFMIDSEVISRMKSTISIPINKIQDHSLNNWDIFKNQNT